MSDNNNSASSNAATPTPSNNNSDGNLEDLLKTLHSQIKSSDWLKVNTVEKLEQDNPDLLKGWNEAIGKEQPQQQQQQQQQQHETK